MAGEGERLAAPFSRFVKQTHEKDMVFRRVVRGCWGAVPGNGGVLEMQYVGGGEEEHD